MSAQSSTKSNTAVTVLKASWVPLIIIVLAQLQMGVNVNALPVSMGPIIDDINAPATSVATALVLYSLFVAAFVMLGAKVGKMFGERLVFQIAVLAHGASMALMAVSNSTETMNTAQAIAGIAAAALVPTLVVLIAANYRERQQEQALGILASIPAVASGLTFVVAGFIATLLSWRVSFGLITVISVAVFIISFRLKPIPRTPGIRIDLVGVVLSALAIACILFGFNNLNTWGLVLAKAAAPISLFGLSPAPFLIALGIVFGQAFFVWSEKRVATKKTPLLAMEVLDSSEERAAVIIFLVAGALGSVISFLIPLYIQIVQGRTPLFTSVAIVPYALAVAAAAILSVRLYDRLTPRRLGVISFSLVTVGAVLLSFTVSNEWATPAVILGLMIVGLGEGTMLTLLFNVLVSASPKHLAGDVGALRGVVNNVSSALGAAFSSVVAVGLLSVFIISAFNISGLPQSLHYEINFDNIDFVSNDQLRSVLSQTSATPAEVNEAVVLNAAARLRALKATFLIVAIISLLTIFPSLRLPGYIPGELDMEELIHDHPSGSPAVNT
ncbi:MAG: MFS transporter [Anaerolineae bacterium]|nr:MFS transporter [Anaerolineae bacterium]MCB9130931.1 MFS transporter [Anaerolineales bacterium]MCO5245520.1 MFS transporter [Anaerolineae bacterium]